MKHLLGPLRVRLAIAGFVAIYSPVLILVMVVGATQEDINVTQTTAEVVRTVNWPVVAVTAVVLAPLSAALAWWWAGRAVRPVNEAIVLQERLIEEASHELRTPLSVLTNSAEVLLQHPKPTLEIYRASVERSLATARRLGETIESLLVDARGRARTIVVRPTDLTNLVGGVVKDLEQTAKRADVTLRCHGDRSAEAPVDGPSVERAVTNLVTNALKASPPSSVVSVVVTKNDSSVVITVTDQGPGIPEPDQGQVFDRYWRGVSEQGDGSGIGLSIVRQIAMAHGGDVTVSSPVEHGIGTSFHFVVAL